MAREADIVARAAAQELRGAGGVEGSTPVSGTSADRPFLDAQSSEGSRQSEVRQCGQVFKDFWGEFMQFCWSGG